jgi:hypothetical protein
MKDRIASLRRPRLVRVAVCSVALGLTWPAGGCGGPSQSGSQAESEKVPEGIVKLKEAMKERAAAKKKGHSIGAQQPPAGR